MNLNQNILLDNDIADDMRDTFKEMIEGYPKMKNI